MTATGQIPRERTDVWYARLGDANRPNTTVCDGVGRFSLSDPTKPQWINYTGGDSVWSVTDTGAAVYVGGHFRWLDNPDGYGSRGVGDKTSGAPAVIRRGIGAIDPASGLALPWNPGLGRTKIGGKALLSDAGGLWIGNDATTFAGEPRYGLQSVRLPPPPAADQVVWAVGESCDADLAADGSTACAQVGRLIAADPETDAVLGLGGLQDPRGSAADYERSYDPAMGRGAGLYERTLPVPGTEDYRTTDAAGYFDYWGGRAGDRTRGYYASDLGAWTLAGGQLQLLPGRWVRRQAAPGRVPEGRATGAGDLLRGRLHPPPGVLRRARGGPADRPGAVQPGLTGTAPTWSWPATMPTTSSSPRYCPTAAPPRPACRPSSWAPAVTR